MTKLAIVYHSGYGHTAKVAEHVKVGAEGVHGVSVAFLKADDLQDANAGPWDQLAAADAIIFGAPTYMGSVSAVMQKFLEASSKVWFTHGWKDKIAAGFTNSGSLAGDKNEALKRFATIAAQHGMIWAGLPDKSGFTQSGSDFKSATNRAGHYLGLATMAATDLPADQAPDAADLETARLFGARIAQVTARWVRGSV
jgi:NAD(P)H dehydrogenase (quinone)